MTKIKICGLRRVEDIGFVNNFCPDYIGFVLAPSKRQITLEQAKTLKSLLKPSIKAVGVFVNESIERILCYKQERVIDMIQLHGDEDLTYMKKLKEVTQLPIIKAIHIENEQSFGFQKAYIDSELVDFILLDTFTKGTYGGSGKSFDWSLLSQIKRPYFLAGGITPQNITTALESKPYAIDVSSGVETEGFKDEQKIKELMEKSNR